MTSWRSITKKNLTFFPEKEVKLQVILTEKLSDRVIMETAYNQQNFSRQFLQLKILIIKNSKN